MQQCLCVERKDGEEISSFSADGFVGGKKYYENDKSYNEPENIEKSR